MGAGFGPPPSVMEHIKILARGSIALVVLCIITAVVMALIAAVWWLMFFHMWVIYVAMGIGLAYWLGLQE